MVQAAERVTVYRVYWTHWSDTFLPFPDDIEGKAHAYETTDMVDALKFAEARRKEKDAGERISHITMVGENPNCVGKMGVDVTGPDYDWRKRRP